MINYLNLSKHNINISHKDINNIDYNVSYFPDGDIRLELYNINRKYDIDIDLQIKNPSDIYIVMQLSNILNTQKVKVNRVRLFYYISSRMDRIIDFNYSYTLEIISDIINKLNANKVIIFDPHSDKSLQLIKNSEYYHPLLDADYNFIYKAMIKSQIVAPDKGSVTRNLSFVEKYSKKYLEFDSFITNANGIMDPIIFCDKKRDCDGKLLSFNIINENEYIDVNDLMVIDDLCDGGGTFLGLAPCLRKLTNIKGRKLRIYVTHMIQKNAIIKLSEVYDDVYFTNSFNDWENDNDIASLPNVHILKLK